MACLISRLGDPLHFFLSWQQKPRSQLLSTQAGYKIGAVQFSRLLDVLTFSLLFTLLTPNRLSFILYPYIKTSVTNQSSVFCTTDITTQNTTNSTKLVNETSPLVSVSKHITKSPSSQPSNSKNTVSPTPTRWEKAKKFVKKKVYSKNGTKQRKNRRPLYRSKLSKWTKKQTSTTASDTTPSAGTSVTHCSVAECDHWRPCLRDVKRSRKCVCIEADCIGYWNASSRLGHEDNTDMKGRKGIVNNRKISFPFRVFFPRRLS